MTESVREEECMRERQEGDVGTHEECVDPRSPDCPPAWSPGWTLKKEDCGAGDEEVREGQESARAYI